MFGQRFVLLWQSLGFSLGDRPLPLQTRFRYKPKFSPPGLDRFTNRSLSTRKSWIDTTESRQLALRDHSRPSYVRVLQITAPKTIEKISVKQSACKEQVLKPGEPDHVVDAYLADTRGALTLVIYLPETYQGMKLQSQGPDFKTWKRIDGPPNNLGLSFETRHVVNHTHQFAESPCAATVPLTLAGIDDSQNGLVNHDTTDSTTHAIILRITCPEKILAISLRQSGCEDAQILRPTGPNNAVDANLVDTKGSLTLFLYVPAMWQGVKIQSEPPYKAWRRIDGPLDCLRLTFETQHVLKQTKSDARSAPPFQDTVLIPPDIKPSVTDSTIVATIPPTCAGLYRPPNATDSETPPAVLKITCPKNTGVVKVWQSGYRDQELWPTEPNYAVYANFAATTGPVRLFLWVPGVNLQIKIRSFPPAFEVWETIDGNDEGWEFKIETLSYPRIANRLLFDKFSTTPFQNALNALLGNDNSHKDTLKRNFGFLTFASLKAFRSKSPRKWPSIEACFSDENKKNLNEWVAGDIVFNDDSGVFEPAHPSDCSGFVEPKFEDRRPKDRAIRLKKLIPASSDTTILAFQLWFLNHEEDTLEIQVVDRKRAPEPESTNTPAVKVPPGGQQDVILQNSRAASDGDSNSQLDVEVSILNARTGDGKFRLQLSSYTVNARPITFKTKITDWLDTDRDIANELATESKSNQREKIFKFPLETPVRNDEGNIPATPSFLVEVSTTSDYTYYGNRRDLCNIQLTEANEQKNGLALTFEVWQPAAAN